MRAFGGKDKTASALALAEPSAEKFFAAMRMESFRLEGIDVVRHVLIGWLLTRRESASCRDY
jgi:hypothetical protein